jgi:hypothetical protein
MTVPRDNREQRTAFDVIVGHMDGRWPAFGSPALQRVNQDAYVLAPPPARRREPSGEVGSSSPGPVEVAEESKPRTMAKALWPDLA